MFGIFKYFWVVVFLGLCYAGYYFGLPLFKSYTETNNVYGRNNFYSGDLYKEDYRVNARKLLAQECSLGVVLRSPNEQACRGPQPKHPWEAK